MQHIKSYYELRADIRYYALLPKNMETTARVTKRGWEAALGIQGTLGTERLDALDWKEPPHLVLANLPLNSTTEDFKIIESFISKYGPLTGESRRLPPKDGAPQFYVKISDFNNMRDCLRRAWRGDSEATRWIEARIENKLGTIRLSAMDKRLEVLVTELEQFIWILFLRDYAAGKARICQSPDCPATYFLQSRKGQTFCSHKCAVLANVRRFRQREATRKRKKAGRKRS